VVPKADVAEEAAAAAAAAVEEVEIAPPTRFPLLMFDLAKTLDNADAAFEDEVIPRIMVVRMVMVFMIIVIAAEMFEAFDGCW